MTTKNSTLATSGAKDAVLSFLKALNDDDFDRARDHTSDSLSFVGVLGSRDGADAYFEDMKRMRLKYDIQKVFVEGNDVCVLYEINMSGAPIFCCGWYQVEDGKISSIRVVFDPRPVLEGSGKK